MSKSVAFIRKRHCSSGTVCQVVESWRDGKQVKQRVLCSLRHESTIAAALLRIKQHLGSPGIHPRWRKHWAAEIAKLEAVQQQTGLP